MVAYTLCSNQECLNADMCERFTAKRGKKCSIKYFLPNADKCASFIGNSKYKTWAIVSGQPLKAGYKSISEFQAIGRGKRIPGGKSIFYENGMKFIAQCSARLAP